MRLLLLQDQVYLPSLGGGNKATRLLIESLAELGHDCAVVSPALTTRAGPTSAAELLAEMRRRKVAIDEPRPGLYLYEHRGVSVDAMIFADAAVATTHMRKRIQAFDPDWILVSDDKGRSLLPLATASGRRVAMIVQTAVHLPFGPLSTGVDAEQEQRMRAVDRLVVISRFLQDYIARHARLDSQYVSLPVFGSGPFPARGRHDRGSVTLINPCVEKGLPIFLELAASHPSVEFAAVPTWGADAAVRSALAAVPNVAILEPADDIGPILERTRILLAPSLWPESFGYVVIEAMLRGIPVLASDIGGLPEAKLGVDYLLPVTPARHHEGRCVSPPQDIRPWNAALDELLSSWHAYERCARESQDAALRFHAGVDVRHFEALLA
jgi:glycosyltransferase involved in cell wall biosynthesis